MTMTFSNLHPMLSAEKEALDKHDREALMQLCAEVKYECKLCLRQVEASAQINHPNTASKLHQHLKEVYELLRETDFVNQLRDIHSFSSDYDFRNIRANGFRSFISIVTICLVRILAHLRNLDRKFTVWPEANEESLIAYLRCLEELAQCIMLIREFPKFAASQGHLFPHLKYTNLPLAQSGRHDNLGPHVHVASSVDGVASSTIDAVTRSPYATVTRYNQLVDCFDLIQQEVFYGRPIAFYFDSTTQNFFRMLVSIMAGFGDSFQSAMAGVSGFVNAVYRSVTSFLSPEERGVRIADITRNASVQFCKRFWSLAENRFLIEVPNLLLPQLAVAHTFTLPNIPITLNVDSDDERTVTINPPSNGAGVKVRLVSKVRRRGMDWVLSQGAEGSTNAASANRRKQSAPLPASFAGGGGGAVETDPSPHLLVHIHGGGFVALSAETHDMYVRPWAAKLNCPILSINYSLAPEAPYPQALDECFYAVCWAMANRERLGAAPDARVVVCGDSAGGNLTLGVCLRAASLHLSQATAMPAGAMVAYAPTLVAYVPSPSRMLSISDPLLPIGIIARCILAYGGVDEAAYLASFDQTDATPTADQHPTPTRLKSAPFWSRLWSSWFTPSSSSSNAPNATPGTIPTAPSIDRFRAIHRRVTLAEDLCWEGTKENIPVVAKPRHQQRPRSADGKKPDSVNAGHVLFSTGSFDGDSEHSSPSSSSPPTSSSRTTPRRPSLGANPTTTVTVDNPEDPILPLFGIDETLQRLRRCPVPQDGFLSPYLASDDLIRGLPPLAIMASQFDPFLDDCLELAKRADNLSVPVELQVATQLPHGFLNFAFINPNYNRATMACSDIIGRLFRGEVGAAPRNQ